MSTKGWEGRGGELVGFCGRALKLAVLIDPGVSIVILHARLGSARAQKALGFAHAHTHPLVTRARRPAH